MKIRVLGASGSEVPGHNSPAFLVDEFLLMDAGTISLSLDRDSQCKITHIFLTHAHLDHIKGIPFLVDNIVSTNQACALTILSGKEVLKDLKKHLFNNRIWPDFSRLPKHDAPVMRYQEISTRNFIEVHGYRIYSTPVHHSVPAYGYMIEDPEGNAVLYTGDTGPTEKIWTRMRKHNVKALITEVSFPDELEELARVSGHLTPSLLKGEIQKMPVLPARIYISHLKLHYKHLIEKQLATVDAPPIVLLKDNMLLYV
ncbi:3',5'-cyclic-nucleotide phosphodiesterase [Desulforhabdus amnigena]|jgi:ribonuclease BN (tRNA processing enzyme)|uniref:cAMP phosphodiesterase class-II:metallo-beta-lactamase superfamily protein n=1 Tax=Desulforhabdus amnigena TaxID=40218 RepID=A0A9W6D0A5_9BACT|nr:3',5'-cyclic-nucleotide phosphodiesterase [Desulforhabdus amnigena]NLJ28997.1 3',5'-cyclic-nucleotide phosphodiesterase [Deltaproteobacteria bacterium]GLI33652.1 cAMP phosphodiesterase class-II:metallo-beta-lactamase superfamily protein [Desulforhabdus amnigena]